MVAFGGLLCQIYHHSFRLGLVERHWLKDISPCCNGKCGSIDMENSLTLFADRAVWILSGLHKHLLFSTTKLGLALQSGRRSLVAKSLARIGLSPCTVLLRRAKEWWGDSKPVWTKHLLCNLPPCNESVLIPTLFLLSPSQFQFSSPSPKPCC